LSNSFSRKKILFNADALWAIFGHYWAIMGHYWGDFWTLLGVFWTLMGDFGHHWAILDIMNWAILLQKRLRVDWHL
jgi:hypothetical protein